MTVEQPGSKVARPRPSASIVLLRQVPSGHGIEVLMARRSEEARFMPGVWVFPGGAVDPGDGNLASGASAYRACARRELAEEAGIALAEDSELIPFARWITPETLPIRFDARFFLAVAPPDATPTPDGGETTDARWFEPRGAAEAGRRDQVAIAFPTLRQLDELSRYRSIESLLAAYRDRQPEPILPVVVQGKDGTRLSLPGDPDYPDKGPKVDSSRVS